MIGYGAGDRLTNPPGRISREFIASTIFVFSRRRASVRIPFLNQIQEAQAAVPILLGDRDHESQIASREAFVSRESTDRTSATPSRLASAKMRSFGGQVHQIHEVPVPDRPILADVAGLLGGDLTLQIVHPSGNLFHPAQNRLHPLRPQTQHLAQSGALSTTANQSIGGGPLFISGCLS